MNDTMYAIHKERHRMIRVEFINNMKRAHLGDEKARECLYTTVFGKITATAFGIVQNKDDAYDIASNVFIKMLEFDGDIDSIKSPVGYLIAMTRNESINYIKKKNREISVFEVRGKTEDIPDLLWIVDIERLLSRDEQDIFELHILWDRSLKEIAEQLGVTLGAVRSRYRKIKKIIYDYYKKGEV